MNGQESFAISQEKNRSINASDSLHVMTKVSWKFGNSTYSGTVIRKTANATYARTQNGKVKKIIKKNKKLNR